MLSRDKRIEIFLSSLEKGNPDFIDDLEEKAINDNVPIIKKPVQGLLRVLLKMLKPERVLEIGTAVGFSAMFMMYHAPEIKRLTTIEDYKKRFDEAEKNFEAYGFSDRTELIFGDANEILPKLEEPYDLIFMDAAKAQYINYLPEAVRLLKSGGMLIADNCLQDGDILESRFIIERRDRTIHKRMREFLYCINNSDELESTVLDIGDGVALCVRK